MYVGVLLSAPTMVKTQSIHRAIPIIMNQSSDSKENHSKRGSFLTQILASDKLHEVKKLREKRIEGVRDRLKGLGIQCNPHTILS
jgi:retron-type reverse transcriptase